MKAGNWGCQPPLPPGLSALETGLELGYLADATVASVVDLIADTLSVADKVVDIVEQEAIDELGNDVADSSIKGGLADVKFRILCGSSVDVKLAVADEVPVVDSVLDTVENDVIDELGTVVVDSTTNVCLVEVEFRVIRGSSVGVKVGVADEVPVGDAVEDNVIDELGVAVLNISTKVVFAEGKFRVIRGSFVVGVKLAVADEVPVVDTVEDDVIDEFDNVAVAGSTTNVCLAEVEFRVIRGSSVGVKVGVADEVPVVDTVEDDVIDELGNAVADSTTKVWLAEVELRVLSRSSVGVKLAVADEIPVVDTSEEDVIDELGVALTDEVTPAETIEDDVIDELGVEVIDEVPAVDIVEEDVIDALGVEVIDEVPAVDIVEEDVIDALGVAVVDEVPVIDTVEEDVIDEVAVAVGDEVRVVEEYTRRGIEEDVIDEVAVAVGDEVPVVDTVKEDVID